MTSTELKVLQLTADGEMYREIAASLDRSSMYVKKVISKVVQKLGADNKTHAVAIALRKGLIQ